MTAPLTPRQLEIAELVAEGLSNAAIGQRLRISKRTVEAHLAVIALRLPGDGPTRERILRYRLSQVQSYQQHKEAA